MLNESHATKVGLIESLKESVGPEMIANKIGVDKHVLVDVSLYGAIGFFSGFLLKKYSEYFIALALLFVGIVVLQQFDYVSVSINTVKIHEILGLQSIPMTSDKYGALLLEWMQANVAGAASLVVGFLIGLKIG